MGQRQKRGTGRLTQRNGRWVAATTNPETGRQTTRTLGTIRDLTSVEAETAAADWIASLHADNVPATTTKPASRRHHVNPDNDDKARRFPPGDLDQAVTRAINNLLSVRMSDTSKETLALKAGKSRSHASRALADSGPRQAWTISDIDAYAKALGVTLGELLAAAELISVPTDATTLMLTDPDLNANWVRAITNLINLAKTASFQADTSTDSNVWYG